jgi:hypothetical protein
MTLLFTMSLIRKLLGSGISGAPQNRGPLPEPGGAQGELSEFADALVEIRYGVYLHHFLVVTVVRRAANLKFPVLFDVRFKQVSEPRRRF